MPFSATVYRVLIASPSDTQEEREIIPSVINDWNASSSETTGIILMPVKWETHSYPKLGSRPQEIINKQIVDNADILVGVFWTRIGTSTGEHLSGTVEEIHRFSSENKPIMLYFSENQISPEKIDPKQFSALKEFKDSMKSKGLIESYSNLPDFKNKFSNQLRLNLQNIIDTENEDLKRKGREPKKIIKEAKEEAIDRLGKLSPEDAELYLIKAIDVTKNESGWSNLSAFAKYLTTYTPVKYKDFGYAKLRPYLESTNLFEFKEISKTEIEIKLSSKQK
jgi:hypothetical protein